MLHEAQRRDLCEKIARWRGWNAFNEEATIQGIVLPILELAGYDTRNPEEVLPQARDIQGNKPDLMLYKTSPLSNIEARLREAARQVEWEKHCTAWELTGQMVIPLQKAVAELSSQFDQEQIISCWIQNFKQHLQEQMTPQWWEETNPVKKESMTVSEKDDQIGRFSLQQIADSGFQVEFTYPNTLWIGEEKVVLDRMKSWKSVVRAVIRALDEQGCLPPPYYPFAKGFILYADTPTLFKRSVVINSSRYGTLYVNQGECTADRSARALFSLVKEAQCPQISPSSIYLELQRWSP